MLLGVALDKRFRIERRVEDTPLGVVYRCRDLDDGVDLALRTVHPRTHLDDARLAELRARVADAAKLRSDTTVRTLRMIERPGVVAWLTELVDARPLDRVLREEGRLTIWRSLDNARQIATSIAEAHQHGIVHGDVRPENVLVSQVTAARDHIKLHGYTNTPLRAAGSLATQRHLQVAPHYVAPEQIRREPPAPAHDLYALGVVLYEMLSGLRPYDAEDPVELLHRKLEEEPMPLAQVAPEIDAGVAALVDGLLARDPAARHPQSAEALVTEIADHINRLARGLPPKSPRVDLARAVDRVEPAGRGPSGRKIVALGATLGLLAGGAAFGWQWMERAPAPPGPASTPSPTARPAPVATPKDATAAVAPPSVAPAAVPSNVASAPGPARPQPAAPAVAPKAATKPTGLTPTLRVGQGGVTRLAVFSRDGALLVTSSDDRALTVRDGKTGTPTRALEGLQGPVAGLAISPDGKLVAAGTAEGELHLWDLGSSGSGRALKKLDGGVRALGFDETGKELLVADHTRTMVSLSTTADVTGERRAPLKLGRGGPAYAAAFSGDGRTIVVVNAGTGRRIVPRDVVTGKVRLEVDAEPLITRVVADRVGRYVAAASSTGVVQILDLEAAGPGKVVNHGALLTSLAIHPTSPILATGGANDTVRLWDAAAAQRKELAAEDADGGSEPITVGALAFRPGDGALLTANSSGRLRLIDTTTGKATDAGATVSGPPALALSADGRQVLAGGQDGVVHTLDLARGTRPARVAGHARVLALATVPGPDATRTAVVTLDGHVKLLDGERIVWDVGTRAPAGDVTTDGREVVVAMGTAGAARRLAVADGKTLGEIGPAGEATTTVRTAPDNARVAVGTEQGTASIHASGTGQLLYNVGLAASGVRALAWRPDGLALAAIHADRTVMMTMIPAGDRKPAVVMKLAASRPVALAFAPDAVVVVTEDGKLHRWIMATATTEAVALDGPVEVAAFSGDGAWLVVGDVSGRMRVHQVTGDGTPRAFLYADGTGWLAWTPVGRFTGDDNGVKLLELDDGKGPVPASNRADLRDPAAIGAALFGP